ncbi:hypothetical protein EMIHUDRAFT_459662, partial [Emiliania huxleyi CCMP1516]
ARPRGVGRVAAGRRREDRARLGRAAPLRRAARGAARPRRRLALRARRVGGFRTRLSRRQARAGRPAARRRRAREVCAADGALRRRAQLPGRGLRTRLRLHLRQGRVWRPARVAAPRPLRALAACRGHFRAAPHPRRHSGRAPPDASHRVDSPPRALPCLPRHVRRLRGGAARSVFGARLRPRRRHRLQPRFAAHAGLLRRRERGRRAAGRDARRGGGVPRLAQAAARHPRHALRGARRADRPPRLHLHHAGRPPELSAARALRAARGQGAVQADRQRRSFVEGGAGAGGRQLAKARAALLESRR